MHVLIICEYQREIINGQEKVDTVISPIMRLLGCFSDAKGQRTHLSMVRFDPISNSFEMSCMSSENDWLRKKNTPRKGRDTVFSIIEFSPDLSQNLVQPSPILLCMRSSYKSRRFSYLKVWTNDTRTYERTDVG